MKEKYITPSSTVNLKNQRPTAHDRSEWSCLIRLQLVGNLRGDSHGVIECNGVMYHGACVDAPVC